MLKIIVGNKAYSSWSLRGWLALRQSGLPFEEEVVALYGDGWAERRQEADLVQSNGKVPVLWDGDAVIWESSAIIDYLADKAGRDLFWPKNETARAFALSISAEMHAGFVNLRSECPTNFRRRYPHMAVTAEATADVARIVSLWDQALTRFGGDDGFLFGAFSAADIMYAPVVTRFLTYALPIPEFAQAYCDRVMAQPFVAEWMAAAHAEQWVLDKFER